MGSKFSSPIRPRRPNRLSLSRTGFFICREVELDVRRTQALLRVGEHVGGYHPAAHHPRTPPARVRLRRRGAERGTATGTRKGTRPPPPPEEKDQLGRRRQWRAATDS